MKNTPYKGYRGIRLPRELQLERVKEVIGRELTPLQRQTLLDYYIQGKNIVQIARERGVNKSTVCRTLHRAERVLRGYLRY